MNPWPKEKWKVKLIFALFLVLGILLTWIGYGFLEKGLQSKSWLTTEGQVINSKVSQEFQSSGGYWYKPEIVYTYSVEGNNYSSNFVTVEPVCYNNPQKPTKIVNLYPSGTKVTVYYSPNDPSVAVLEPGAKSGGYVITVVGIIFFLIGILGIMGILPKKRDN
ncbi:DUF3592 domain-containing protein [Candidatus Woesearchaeota archaeon]|nr:DUF3592 domain-containing protein [Candidatus Woesearchaeota archaeon]